MWLKNKKVNKLEKLIEKQYITRRKFYRMGVFIAEIKRKLLKEIYQQEYQEEWELVQE